VRIELRHNFSGRRDVAEERLGSTAAALFLFQYGLAQVNAFAADVNIAWPFDEWANIAVAFPTEGTERVLFCRARTFSASSEVFSCGHSILIVGSRRGHRRANQSMLLLEWLRWPNGLLHLKGHPCPRSSS